jgi:hypothetical protein
MAHKAISLKYTLSGEVEEFLDLEDMACPHTKNGVVELINQISAYREEGKPLFPEVYITDDLKFIQRSLVNTEFHAIGKASKSANIFRKALKKCAPLTLGGWCIYILRLADEFQYGIFRSETTIVSIPVSTSLLENGNMDSKLLLVRQVADKIVELRGVRENSLVINFGIKSTSTISPLAEQLKFIDKIVENVAANLKDQARVFLKRLFLYVMQNGHGNLCLILKSENEYPDFLKDGIVLERKIEFAVKISELNQAINGSAGLSLLQENSKLNGTFNLIAGMMMSDGITVFSNNGEVLAYNVFMKHPDDDESLKHVTGGARSRTFHVMTTKLSTEIVSVYIQSQDGETQTQIYE